MTTSAEVAVLGVWLGARRVGTLVRLPDDRITFAFDPEYRNDQTREILSLGFKGKEGGLVTVKTTQTRLPPYFSNLLPEGPLRTYVAARAGIKEVREFPLLALVGGDLPGNVRVIAESHGPSAAEPRAMPQGERGPLKFSLAGVQLKFSALESASGGLSVPVSGAGGDWILKLPSGNYGDLPRHEHAMLELARATGLSVPQLRLVKLSDVENLPEDIPWREDVALAVRRFDRRDGERLHMEDFAQVFGVYPDEKYTKASSENIARVLYAESGLDQLLELVRRLVFTVLIGNADMHLKNWSLLYRNGKHPVLAPAYDFVGTVVYLPGDRMLALSIGGSKSMDEIGLDHFVRFANRAGAPIAPITEIVQQTVASFKQAWRNFEVFGGMSDGHREAIDAHHAKLKLWHAG
ncbi:MAG: type II toxin-antitoxin system HipA family toxin [Gemmatimonadota bacterium]